MNWTLNLTFLSMSLKVIYSRSECLTRASKFSVHFINHFFFFIWFLQSDIKRADAFFMCISGASVEEFLITDTARERHDEITLLDETRYQVNFGLTPFFPADFNMNHDRTLFSYAPISSLIFICKINFKRVLHLHICSKSLEIWNLSELYLPL